MVQNVNKDEIKNACTKGNLQLTFVVTNIQSLKQKIQGDFTASCLTLQPRKSVSKDPI